MRWLLSLLPLLLLANPVRADDGQLEAALAKLRSADATVRINATDEVAAAGKSNPQRAAFYLGQATHDTNATVRLHAVSALGKLGEPRVGVPALLARLEDPEWLVFRKAVLVLGRLGVARRVREYASTMPDRRRAALAEFAVTRLAAGRPTTAMTALNDPEHFPLPEPPDFAALARRLKEKEDLRLRALTAILHREDLPLEERAALLLAEAMQEREWRYPNAISILDRISDARPLINLADAMIRHDHRWAIKILSRDELRFLGAALKTVLQDSKGRVREAAIDAILRQRLTSVSAQQFLAESMLCSESTQQLARLAIAELELRQPIVRLLRENLGSEKPEVVIAAITTLAAFDDVDTREQLHQLLGHPQEVVRLAAALGVAQQDRDPRPAVEVLIALLQSANTTTRVAAAQQLGQLGPRARIAARALAQATNDRNEAISNAALDAFVAVQKKR